MYSMFGPIVWADETQDTEGSAKVFKREGGKKVDPAERIAYRMNEARLVKEQLDAARSRADWIEAEYLSTLKMDMAKHPGVFFDDEADINRRYNELMTLIADMERYYKIYPNGVPSKNGA